MEYKYDIAIMGDIAGLDIIMSEFLSRNGLKCCILRKGNNNSRERITLKNSFCTSFDVERNCFEYSNVFEFLKLCRSCRLVLSINAALIGALRFLWPIRYLLKLPPVIHMSTGSDIAELSQERSILGFVFRQYLRFVDLNWCHPYPHLLKNLIKLKVPNVVFMRIPFFLSSIPESKHTSKNRDEIIFFHPSHLDWKVNDPGRNRNSSKGNDRFIRAFARAVNDGLNAVCVMLDRGPDKELAKNLIADLGVAGNFIWKGHLSREKLFEEFQNADVIVDQFDVGGLGGIAIEAMSAGKPVMMYLQKNCLGVLYADHPPVLNCCMEDEIYEQLLKCKDKSMLEQIGRVSKEWVNRYYNWETCLDQFLFHYTRLTGHRLIDYGWDKDPYNNK